MAGAQRGAEGADAGGGADKSESRVEPGAVDGVDDNAAEGEGGTGGGSAAGGAAAAVEEPTPPKKKLTPQEAAMLAFREERRKVAKVSPRPAESADQPGSLAFLAGQTCAQPSYPAQD